jgi:hypothetical protein
MICGFPGSAARINRVFAAVLLLFAANFFGLGQAVGGDKPTTLSEQQVKAAYLFNFIKFVDWPQGAFPDKNSPILIGGIGS